jgi:transposase
MKAKDKQESIEMRRNGSSIKDIADKLSVSKSTISTWVKDIILTPRQRLTLKERNHSPEVVERRRQSRLKNEFKKRASIIDESSIEIQTIDKQMLKIIGIAIYWSEGGKTMKGMARISNSDPMMIKMSMRFFREICGVKEDRFRAHIHIHSKEAVKKAEKYWSEITGIPNHQFYKTYTIQSKASKKSRKTIPYGTIDVGVCDTKLLLKILGWIEGFKRQLN